MLSDVASRLRKSVEASAPMQGSSCQGLILPDSQKYRAMAAEGPNQVKSNQPYTEKDHIPPRDAGLDGQGYEDDGRGSSSHTADVIRGPEGNGSILNSKEPKLHARDHQAPIHQSRPLHSTTPTQSFDDSPPSGDLHDARQAGALTLEGFVQPSSYLRRGRGYSRPMAPARQPESAVDREQRHGLVSGIDYARASI